MKKNTSKHGKEKDNIKKQKQTDSKNKNNKEKHFKDKKEKNQQAQKVNGKLIIIIILIVILIASISYLIYYIYTQWQNKKMMEDLANFVATPVTEVSEGISEEEQRKQALLANLQELKKQNSDLVGWLTVEGTEVDYPVLQTDNNDYYVNHNFEKQSNELGSIFLDKDCSIEKPTANFLIYGHRSNGGQMFETLTKYKKEDFYKKHPTFEFATLEEVSKYQIIAVFQSQVYLKNQDVFKYYFFKDAENEKEFNNYIENVKKLSLYNIAETAEYGDQLITLSTCDYHVTDGRFAIVAKKVVSIIFENVSNFFKH